MMPKNSPNGNPYADAVKQRVADVQAQQPEPRPDLPPPEAWSLMLAGRYDEAAKLLPPPKTPGDVQDRAAKLTPLERADTPRAILEALARELKEGCSPDQIPTESDLCAFVSHHPAPDQLTVLADVLAEDEDGRLTMSLLGIETAHARWLALEQESHRAPHPLAPLVRAWQERPIHRPRNARPDRTLPVRLGMMNGYDRRAGRLFSPAMYLVPKPDGGQLTLPGFSADVPDLPTPALPLALYDLGVGKGDVTRHGKGAPLALRLWIEAVLSVGMNDRNIDRPVLLTLTLRELLAALYPGPNKPSPSRYVEQLWRAHEALSSRDARVPWEDETTQRRGHRQVVTLTDIPESEDEILSLIVHLPPGSGDGPIISPRLSWWGMKDAACYRALIGLAYRWWQPGVTRRPVGRGKGRFWHQSDNPHDYGDKLSDDEAAALCYPASARSERRKTVFDAWKALGKLEAEKDIRLVEGRILPPKVFPAVPPMWADKPRRRRK